MGAPLFDRQQNGTTLTELGAMVLPHLTEIAVQSDLASDCAVTYALPLHKMLRLGVTCTISPAPLQSLIDIMFTVHPRVGLTTIDSTSRQLEILILNGELDVAFYAEAGEPNKRLQLRQYFSSDPRSSWDMLESCSQERPRRPGSRHDCGRHGIRASSCILGKPSESFEPAPDRSGDLARGFNSHRSRSKAFSCCRCVGSRGNRFKMGRDRQCISWVD